MLNKVVLYLVMMAVDLGMAAVMVFVFGNSLHVSCVRQAGQDAICKISRSLLGMYTVSTRAVPRVVDVSQDRSCDDGCSYRTMLVTASGESVALNEVYTDQGPVLNQMNAFRSFLQGSEPTFTYEEPSPVWVLPAAGAIAL